MIPYDHFIGAFLRKVTEYKYLGMNGDIRADIVIGFMKTAVSQFKKVCLYDLVGSENDEYQCFEIDVAYDDIDELTDIIVDGMIYQWMSAYMFNQENYENVLNTRDFSYFSPAEISKQNREAFTTARRNFENAVREYSYNHGDLTELHS